jgi:hypothetical protein
VRQRKSQLARVDLERQRVLTAAVHDARHEAEAPQAAHLA